MTTQRVRHRGLWRVGGGPSQETPDRVRRALVLAGGASAAAPLSRRRRFLAEGLLPRRVNAAAAALWRPGAVQATAAR
jgi:hypothetical protein